MSDIPLRDFLEVQLRDLNRRLDGLEKLGEATHRELARTTPREYYDARHDLLATRVAALEAHQASDAGAETILDRLRSTGLVLAAAIVGAVASGVATVVLHLSGVG